MIPKHFSIPFHCIDKPSQNEVQAHCAMPFSTHVDPDALPLVGLGRRLAARLEGVELLHVARVVGPVPLDRVQPLAGRHPEPGNLARCR